jgi:hypothetical protein
MTKIHGYTLSELAELDFNSKPSDELKEKFIERTNRHIALVNKYAAKLGLSYPNHDASKLSVLLDGYAFFSKQEEERTEEENMILDIATYIHVTQAPHHPEYWTSTDLSGFTRKNFTPNGIVDATEMPDDALLELCMDWASMSEEFGNSPFEWFNKVNGTRWLFTSEQQKFILDTLEKIWE